jgi:hypothetical protein
MFWKTVRPKPLRLLGYQSAISKALKRNRRVNILVNEDGKIEAEEVRPFPNKNKPVDPDVAVTP